MKMVKYGKWYAAALSALLGACTFGNGVEVSSSAGIDIYGINTESLSGESVPLGTYRGKVALIVNTASQCGFTGQYEGLQTLHERFGEQGFTVLAFPSNDFGGQEPGSAEEIQQFCTSKYEVTFPLFAKVGVKAGESQSPLYRSLGEAAGNLPSWNFGKYLVNRDGAVVQFFGSRTKPLADDLVQAIKTQLAAQSGSPLTKELGHAAPAIPLPELYGEFPNEVQAADVALKLNGSGLCEWGLLGFNLYRGALYAERTSRDPETLLQFDQTYLVHLRFVRKLSSAQLQDAFRASAHYQVGEESPLEGDLQTLLSWMRDVRKGDGMSFVASPDLGLLGYLRGEAMGQITNPDFAKLFLQLYLGNKPPTEGLKKGMLGL